MRYFTPELFVRLQDLTDRNAPQEWDSAAERYTAALQETLPRLPLAVRKLARHPLLHDAEVLCISQARDNLSITLQPELSDGRLIVLSYTLVEDPRINRAAIPAPYQTEYVAWLHDEFGLGEPAPRQPSGRRRNAQGNGAVPVYRHDILLSNGCELSLGFRRFRITRPQQLLPSTRSSLREPGAEVSQSA